MVKQKRKGPEETKKKSKKPKKPQTEEVVPEPDTTRAAPEAGLEGTVASGVQGAGPELPSQEQRVLERKLRKARRREERKRLQEARVPQTPAPLARPSVAELALDYLCRWAQKQESWRFQKTRQTWLLLNMYDSDKVPDEHFSTLLAYLEGLQGKARQLTLQKAEALMQQLDAAGGDDALQGQAPRLRQVLQLLS